MKKTMHNPEFTAAALEMEHFYSLAAAVRSGRMDADTAERTAREHRAIDRAAARTHRTAETMTAEPLAVGPTAIDRAAVAEHLNERGFSVLARRLERGTTDTAAALDRAAAIERETGADIVSKYVTDQAIKGARTLAAAMTFSAREHKNWSARPPAVTPTKPPTMTATGFKCTPGKTRPCRSAMIWCKTPPPIS